MPMPRLPRGRFKTPTKVRPIGFFLHTPDMSANGAVGRVSSSFHFSEVRRYNSCISIVASTLPSRFHPFTIPKTRISLQSQGHSIAESDLGNVARLVSGPRFPALTKIKTGRHGAEDSIEPEEKTRPRRALAIFDGPRSRRTSHDY
jgi:hypothetical protein